MTHASKQGYEIVVEGYLGSSLSRAFEPLKVHHDCGEAGAAFTVLSGELPDQAALYGTLMRLRDLGLTLVSVRRLDNSSMKYCQ